jgi:CzcA family heavy metal efflux pump
MRTTSAIGQFAVRHAVSIIFLVVAACLGGGYAALHMPSSVFPEVNFPRVIIMVDNGTMKADEMMATITRPIEESMKDIPGCKTIRSSTGRGSAEIDVFFTWDVDMKQSELQINSRLSQLRGVLPSTANAVAYRMTFSAFPIIGVSLTSPSRDTSTLWEAARYDLKPRLLRIPGVARVDIVGGRPPEYQVTVDPSKLAAVHLTIGQVADAFKQNNLIVPSGLHEEDARLYLTVVDGRLHSLEDIENLTVPVGKGTPVQIKEIATVDRGHEPAFSRVTADGQEAVLLNIFSQPDASTIEIAERVEEQLHNSRREFPADMTLRLFYDQSLLVRASLQGVWESIAFGLLLSAAILYLFLKNWSSTLVATAVIPVAVLFTILAMKLFGLSFNVMTLGGIAAAIGLVIDDAIVVVEAIYTKLATGLSRVDAVQVTVGEILSPLLGSTLTPVVVFIPLAFLDGITGVFFRALALTMTVALLASLALALTLTPSMASWLMRSPPQRPLPELQQAEESGFLLRLVIRLYEICVVQALRHRWFTLALCGLVLVFTWLLYSKLDSNFLPAIDEGGFVIDYIAPPGTSLTELNRQMLQAEGMLKAVPEVESYSRRTGEGLGVQLVEPNTGDFLVKLKADRQRNTQQVIADVREKFNVALPLIKWDFPGILSDLIGDMTLADQPIEVKLISNNIDFLKAKAPKIEAALTRVPGVVDVLNGIVYTGPTIEIHVRPADAQHFGLSTEAIGNAVNIAMLGQTVSAVPEADRLVNIRVKGDTQSVERIDKLGKLPLRAANGTLITLAQVADIQQTPGELELHRDDLRQDISVAAELEGRDLGSTMAEIRSILDKDKSFPPGSIEYGGTYEEQQESFRKLTVVLILAVVLVFTVALLEFRSFYAPLAIVFGALLSLFGIVAALTITGTSLSVVAFLGAIIGMGIVHKNGILLIDYVEHLRSQGMSLEDAILYSGRRRLRPVLMTSLAAAMGMLPLAYGIGSGADMLRPMAIAVIGAVCISVLLSLVATPTMYYLLLRLRKFGFPARLAVAPKGHESNHVS